MKGLHYWERVQAECRNRNPIQTVVWVRISPEFINKTCSVGNHLRFLNHSIMSRIKEEPKVSIWSFWFRFSLNSKVFIGIKISIFSMLIYEGFHTSFQEEIEVDSDQKAVFQWTSSIYKIVSLTVLNWLWTLLFLAEIDYKLWEKQPCVDGLKVYNFMKESFWFNFFMGRYGNVEKLKKFIKIWKSYKHEGWRWRTWEDTCHIEGRWTQLEAAVTHFDEWKVKCICNQKWTHIMLTHCQYASFIRTPY